MTEQRDVTALQIVFEVSHVERSIVTVDVAKLLQSDWATDCPVSGSVDCGEDRLTTNRGGTAPTARPTAQEVETPMLEQRTYSRWYWFKWRLACLVHPETVCDAWYAQDCPPMSRFDWSVLTFRERIGWRISMWIRESKTWHGWAA